MVTNLSRVRRAELSKRRTHTSWSPLQTPSTRCA